MKTRSKILIALGIIAVLLAGGVYYLYSNLDRIVAAAIEKYGSEATGTKVAVSSVRIRLNAGEGSIGNLSIGNPPGFSSPNAVHLGNISIAVDTGSVTRNPLVIDRILISAPRITYEINESGRSNIDTIRGRVQAAEDEEEDRSPRRGRGKKTGGEKRIVIKTLVIENGEVAIQAASLPGKTLSAPLPRIELHNLGGKRGNAPGEIAAQVVGPLLGQAASAASRAGISQFLGKEAGEVRRELEEKFAVPAKEAAKEAQESVRKLLEKNQGK
ncbi:MAG TPA: hypothetical protein VFU42_03165 [Candidatus Deferrimicrobiaceae bacterium]|nr:hypothetical protein [Candidatus Deferrimicrobiaceae bacterium]